MSNIIQLYQKSKSNYDYCERKIKQVIEDICVFQNLSIHKIESRVKNEESLGEKIEKKGKYSDVSQITDIIGIRIIMLFEDEVDKVAKLLEDEFEVDIKNSVDKRIKDNPEAFGYASLHYVLKLKEPRRNLSEFAPIKDLQFEVQIRSILQHAWAEIEHDLGYKNSSDIPKHIRRNFARVSSFLEAADIEFVRIKEELDKYKSQVREEISTITKYSEIELNKLSVMEYLKTSNDINEIKERLVKELDYPFLDNDYLMLEPMKLFRINNIDGLDSIVKKYKQQMISFALKWKKTKEANPIVNYSFILVTLYYVILYLEHDDEMLNHFLEISDIRDTYHDRIKELFTTFKSEQFLLTE